MKRLSLIAVTAITPLFMVACSQNKAEPQPETEGVKEEAPVADEKVAADEKCAEDDADCLQAKAADAKAKAVVTETKPAAQTQPAATPAAKKVEEPAAAPAAEQAKDEVKEAQKPAEPAIKKLHMGPETLKNPQQRLKVPTLNNPNKRQIQKPLQLKQPLKTQPETLKK